MWSKSRPANAALRIIAIGLAFRLHGRNRRPDHSWQTCCRTTDGAIAAKARFASGPPQNTFMVLRGFLPQAREYLPLALRLGDLAGVEDRIQPKIVS